MTRDEWMTMFRGFPEAEHNRLVLVLQNGAEISIDTVFRFEPHFLILRGRVGGTIDEARGFFIPYSEMVYVRFERVMKLEELNEMFALANGETGLPLPAETTTTTVTKTPTPVNLPRPSTSRTPTPLSLQRPTVPLPSPNDPAAASRLLLQRIKAARTITGGKNGNPTAQ